MFKFSQIVTGQNPRNFEMISQMDTNSTMMISQRMTNIMPIIHIKVSNMGFITNQPIMTPNSNMIVIQLMIRNVLILIL